MLVLKVILPRIIKYDKNFLIYIKNVPIISFMPYNSFDTI